MAAGDQMTDEERAAAEAQAQADKEAKAQADKEAKAEAAARKKAAKDAATLTDEEEGQDEPVILKPGPITRNAAGKVF